jgi:uncharacterized membrane protein
MSSKIVRRLINYTLNGLLIILPVFGTGYIIYQLLKWVDGIIPRLWYSSVQTGSQYENATVTVITENGPVQLPALIQSTHAHDGFSGWGIFVLLGMLIVLGWLGSVFINDRLKGLFENLLDRIPGVNNLYHTISDLLGAFVGNKKKFDKPVLVKVSDDMDLEMIGFITDTDLKELGNIQGKVSVYFPMSYSFSGHMLVVPIRNVKPLQGNPVDIMKYTISGGIVEFDPHEGTQSKR